MRAKSRRFVIFQDPSMDMFAILGDNFYDQTGLEMDVAFDVYMGKFPSLRGELAKTIFDQLSPEVKRRFLLVATSLICRIENCRMMVEYKE